MSRFFLSPGANSDLTVIAEYLQSIPRRSGLRIGTNLREAIENLARQPSLDREHPVYSSLAREEIRSFVALDYVIFFAANRKPVVFIGVFHGKRDIDSLMRQRLG